MCAEPSYARTRSPRAVASTETCSAISGRSGVEKPKRARCASVKSCVMDARSRSGTGSAEDSDRYYGLILNGKTADFASQWLCLYDKRAKTAVAREIEKR